MKKMAMVGFLLTLILVFGVPMYASEQGCLMNSFFCKSLHYSGHGMCYYYEKDPNGCVNITGIPYKKAGCATCHANSCDRCHAKGKKGEKKFSVAKAKEDATCLKCHVRQAGTFMIDKKYGTLGVHRIGSKMHCVDCHGASDTMGGGTKYLSMRSENAIQANCLDCHEEGESKAHVVHNGKLSCEACHVSAITTCYNCHIIEGHKKGAFIPHKSWTLLVNYRGKVTTGNVQTIVYKGKKFIVYAPRLTHSIMKKGRDCNDCHGNKAVTLLKKGKMVPMETFENGKLNSWKGVVPAVEGGLYWVYLEKDKQGRWYKLPDNTPVVTQWGLYARPIAKEQLDKLATPQGAK